jgi:hypothetical protein
MADSEHPCMGAIYDCMSDLLCSVDVLELHGNRAECTRRRDAVHAIVNARWSFLHQPIYTAAYALNLVFMKSELSDEAMDEVDSVLSRMCGSGIDTPI